MKKLSQELTKSYRILIFLFLLSYAGIMIFFASYIKNVSHADINTINSFLLYETGQFKSKISHGKNIESLFREALEECPKADGLAVAFKYKNKIYSENNSEDLKIFMDKIEVSQDIQSFGFYQYEFLYRELDISKGEPLKILIVKDMKEEKELITGMAKISLVLALLTLGISIYVSKKFYNKFIPPLKNLQEITNNINLNNLDYKVETENNFVEFATVVNSYENMLKRLKQQTDSQIDFVNNASHELKTPIFVIGGYVNLIKRWGIENREISMEALNSIGEETKNMSSLVSKLLFLAKDDYSDKGHKNFDISETIESVLNDLKIIYPKQKINFSPKKTFINSDYDLIKQLFLNIIENAIKYGKGNEIDINIKYNKNISVEVRDRGEGISEENLSHIYDKFFRVDKARSRNMGSHGLGLSIVKKITETLNIDIDIKSTLGKGTTVVLTLPVETVAN